MAWIHHRAKQLFTNWYGGWNINYKSVFMKALLKTPAIASLLLATLFGSVTMLHAGPFYHPTNATYRTSTSRAVMMTREAARLAAKRAEMRMVVATAISIYADMDLEDSGLSRKAFESAWIGYYKLRKKGLLKRTNILTICDFSQSSSNQRMYVIDVRNRRMLYRTYVAHGINSGEEFATSFSNKMESCKSSLGFYVTSGTYTGVNGLSLRINGVDKGFNDNARKRAIVIHGANYVSMRVVHKYGVMGTTFGCPAIPTEMTTQIIPVVKNGSCFYIYYPSKKYLNQSKVLNS
ncbi:MAG TPA: murein L,D-transpeptidase catalytic domain family protein [Puia sp.]|nr:murein L,D-transpeptidase catalytic domain family protein [Puia sp.]